MAPFDLTASLADLDPDAPAGPNLELEGDFGALERAAQGTPERQAGNSIIPAEDPDWKDVAKQASALLERTHDLRVLVHLAVARLHLAGLAEYVAVLAMIRERLANRWEHVHPQLDPEDDNDPTLRANALLQLAHPLRVLRFLRTLPLAASERAGAVSWRTIAISIAGLETTDETERKTEAELRAAFTAVGPAKAAALREILATALAELAAIGAAFDTNCGYGYGPDLTPLVKLLQEIARYVDMFGVRETELAGADLSREAVADGLGDHPGGDRTRGDRTGGDRTGPAEARNSAVTAASLTAINTRADAVRLLDLVCRYYEQYEPSSPLPLLIARARGLADKGFLEILQELAPDGLLQAQAIVQSREP
jgi:type VI secretion system protein ImpA